MTPQLAPLAGKKGVVGCPFFPAVIVVLLPLLGCADGPYQRPLMTPEGIAPYEINTGFVDPGVAPSLGHAVPVEGEIISTPQCVAEAREGRDCR